MPSSAFLFNNIAEMYQFMPYCHISCFHAFR
nr:MAG TPA: hypothetical protein [Caudoviricetes sp.]